MQYKNDFLGTINGYSIAEACECNGNLYSFKHENFAIENIEVERNTQKFVIKNYTNINKYINDNFENIIDIFWQKFEQNFEVSFEWLLKIFSIKYNLIFINNYKYSNKFKERILNIPKSIRAKSIEQIAKRLSLTREEASKNESLNDEPIRGISGGISKRRFYITKSQGRIHYFLDNNVLLFDSLNIQHDEDLN